MFDLKPDNRDGSNEALRPHPELGRLLSALDTAEEPLPWSAVQQLVAEAPPVKVTWADVLARRSVRQLRYAMAAMVVVCFGVGMLAVLPAHSNQVGTLVLTKLPSSWDADGVVFNEAKGTSTRLFSALDKPQSELNIVIGERAGRDELAFVMMGIDQQSAEDFMAALYAELPALAAFGADYSAIDTERFGSRLSELAYSISHGGSLDQLSDDELTTYVLRSLAASGFGVEDLRIERRADGKIIIEVEASLTVTVEMGRTQEELEAAGLSEELVGEENFQRLLTELAAP